MPGFEWFGDAERKEVMDVLETGVLFRYGFDAIRKGHWKARTLENEISSRLGVGFCHLCSSGTAALSIALAACGVGAGDEVIVPPFTFVATIEAILQAGGIPVFAEIDDTLCLDPEDIPHHITKATRAVVPVHMCGAMARIDRIKRVCDRHDLILIEDVAQSLGASFQGKALGTFGHAGCFSFDPVKTVTCGEGGAVITNEAGIYQNAHQFADHGHDHIGNDRGQENHPILGMNYRISELNAAVGLAQLRKLDQMLAIQRKHKQALKNCLGQFRSITFRNIPDESGDSATFLTFFLPTASDAKNVATELGKAGVDGCAYWYDNKWHYLRKWDHIKKLAASARLAIHLNDPLPDYDQIDLTRSNNLMSRAVSMQIKLSWSSDDLSRRIEAIEKGMSEFFHQGV
ncbi:MAG: DegT/DnrJ/EryC1/StrS family aminotransferase [Desulfatirhabdiaceae bacterium]